MEPLGYVLMAAFPIVVLVGYFVMLKFYHPGEGP